jgi:hypothetical protein
MSVHVEVRELIFEPSGEWGPFEPSRPRPLPIGTTIEFGRHTGIAVGRRPLDQQVSGMAAEVVADGAGGWDVAVANRHGVVLHPQGLAPRSLGKGERTTITWPRVALYVRGNEIEYQHWVLLESDTPTMPGVSPRATDTVSAEEAKELSPTEELIIRTKFADFLAWPPCHPARVCTDAECESRLPWTGKQIRLQLVGARDKTVGEGMAPSDPEWVHTLVRRGSLPI